MKQRKLACLALLALASAACSKAEDSNIISIDNDAGTPTSIETLPPDEGDMPNAMTMDAENAAAAAENETAPTPPAGTKFPASFQGRWGMVPADCTSNKGDAKGLITVSSDSIRFYESTAKLASVATNDPEHFVGNFDFAGEGQTWKKSEDFKLTGSSNTLVRTDDEGSYKYARCAKG